MSEQLATTVGEFHKIDRGVNESENNKNTSGESEGLTSQERASKRDSKREFERRSAKEKMMLKRVGTSEKKTGVGAKGT